MSALDSRGLTRLQLLVNFGRLYLLDAPGRRRSNSWHNATEKHTSKQIRFKLVRSWRTRCCQRGPSCFEWNIIVKLSF